MAKEYAKLGEHIQRFRERMNLRREDLAARAGISLSYVYYLEGGNKRPQPQLLNAIAAALGLEAESRNELFKAAGYHEVSPGSLVLPIESLVREALSDTTISIEERAGLADELGKVIGEWKRKKEKRRKVSKVVILAAGWQHRLLSTEKIEDTLICAAQEVKRSGIKEVIVVIAPTEPKPRLSRLKNKFKMLRFQTITQEKQLGVGHAITVAQELIDEEPFAVLLPDDVDPRRRALGEMVKKYLACRCSVVAVWGIPKKRDERDTKYYGLALLGNPVRNKEEGLHYVTDLIEKPKGAENEDQQSRMIMGRYILTPEIFDALLEIKPNKATGMLELTDALELMLKQRREVCAYELDQSLLPVAPVRALIEKLIESVNKPERFREILKLVQQTTEKIDRI